VFSAWANVFVAALTPALRSSIDILMVTTMALVWTVNSTLIWGVKFQNSIFLLLQMPPPAQCRPGRMFPSLPPSRRHCGQIRVVCHYCPMHLNGCMLNHSPICACYPLSKTLLLTQLIKKTTYDVSMSTGGHLVHI